ncbi:hypothetical protein D8I35_16630 [Corticibacter populi]|uniref:Glutathionylspermidine synthase pre-ATP-grasp-like domain-containing protein n=1 Tax=Corticibacter populi TaxID=1550736 RepID=A0A3M6QL94_9BURK|nr:glutathionylspermidine synthase family protein [Corticibacter populi]RMX03501.1 hypothetical protein D8I35_16630 [Corticibacter populi]RZS29946.1 glutathionylspermidine synthase [Corticibacter populi]
MRPSSIHPSSLAAAITSITCPVTLDLRRLIEEELPFTYHCYASKEALGATLQELFAHHLAHSSRMPFYSISTAAAVGMGETLRQYYLMLCAALDHLFFAPMASEQERQALIARYFDCPMMRSHGRMFTEYAMATRRAASAAGLWQGGLQGSTIYGRFDAAADPVTGRITGVYEFNGNTPVMLFESVNLQSYLAGQIDGDLQFNDWWGQTVEQLQNMNLAGQKIAAVCTTDAIEDIITSETILQVFDAAGLDCYLVDIADLDYDQSNPANPFIVNEVEEHPDILFFLTPWEELVENFSLAFEQYRYWFDRTRFLEPPWRWFISHKGILAWVSDLLAQGELQAYSALPHLPTALSLEALQARQQALGLPTGSYVAKPVIGRLSANVTVVSNGQVLEQSAGAYGDVPMVYQHYCAPGRTETGNFIVCGWMSCEDYCETLAIREFDHHITDFDRERFVPHILRGQT